MTLIDAVRVGLQRNENIGGGIGLECGRQNPDDGIRFPAQQDGLADQVLIAAKTVLPQLVGQHSRFRSVRQVFLLRERTSCGWRDPKYAKIARGDVDSLDLLGTIATAQV